MAARRGLSKLLLLLMLTLLIALFSADKCHENLTNDVCSLLVVSKLDKRSYPSRNLGLHRHRETTCSASPCLKATAGIYLIKYSLCAGYLVLLANDVNPHSGPAVCALICSSCNKTIRRNQTRLQCVSCELNYQLKCLGADYDLSGSCHLCSTRTVDVSSESSSSE